jgi:hypothetical protein
MGFKGKYLINLTRYKQDEAGEMADEVSPHSPFTTHNSPLPLYQNRTVFVSEANYFIGLYLYSTLQIIELRSGMCLPYYRQAPERRGKV